MAALSRRLQVSAVLAILACAGDPAQAQDDPVAQWREMIGAASRRFSIPAAWIAAVMRVESAGLPMRAGKPITSPKGAMGLMQIMPGTWRDLCGRYGLGPDPYDPQANILAGTAYLRELYARYGYPNLFAAYNAGPGRLEAHLERGKILPDETEDYLAKLGLATDVAPSSGQGLFVALGRHAFEARSAGGLFVTLRSRTAAR